MTAHKQKPTITPERMKWFTQYFSDNNGDWGIWFHVSLDDGNYGEAADPDEWDGFNGAVATPEIREQIAWFNQLTVSQRKRLGKTIETYWYAAYHARHQ